MVAAVGRLVDAAFGRRPPADDGPRPALAPPGARVYFVRVGPVDRDRHGAGLIVDEEHLLPRPAAVFRAVHAALGSPSERVADRRDERDVRVLRVHLHLADLADVLQPGELPRSARVRGPVHAAPEDHIRPDCLAARPDVDDVRVGIGDVDCANRSGRHLAVGDRRPRDAVVPGLPDAAAGRAHVEHAGLRAHAGRRRRAAAAVRPDRSPPQILIGLRIDDGVRARLGNRASRGATVPEHDERQRRAGEQYQLSHDGSPCWCAILAPARSDQIVTGARLPPSLKLRRTAEALAEAGQPRRTATCLSTLVVSLSNHEPLLVARPSTSSGRAICSYLWKRATRTAFPRTWPSIALTTAVRVSAVCCGVPCGTSSLVSSAYNSKV